MEHFIKPMEQFIKHFQKYLLKCMEQFIQKMEQFIKPFQKDWWTWEIIILRKYPVKILGTRPPISCHVSPIGQNVVIPNTNSFSEKRPDHNRQNRRQHDYSYYQPQPALQNHRHQYHNDRRILQASYKNYYDRDKGVSHGMIGSGKPTPEKQATPIIPFEKESYSRKKLTDSSSTSLRRGISGTKNEVHYQSYNQKKRLHILPLLELNLVRFQLKIIIYLLLFLS